MDVQLYVYDLSQGLARQMSRQFLGVQIDAVYHTSLVFGGVEYFFGRGVQTCYPGSTHHGRPMEVVPLGQTALPVDIIMEYLESLKEIYPPESYDLFAHNCNNFTNDFSMFLVGHGIPDHITSLPKTVLDTPFGQMLRPQIESAMRPVTQAPNPQIPAANGLSRGGAIPPQNGTSSLTSSKLSGQVHNVTTVSRLDQLLGQSKTSCAVIFFTSASCAPCKVLYPTYDELAAEAGDKACLIKVDVSDAREIGLKYSIRATPTFITFLKGKQEETWSGSDASRLRGTLRLLVQSAFPPHPHKQLKLPKFSRQSTKPITYTKIPPLEKLETKIGQAGSHPGAKQALNYLRSCNSSTKGQEAPTPIPDLPAVSSFLLTSLTTTATDSLFALYDLFRLLLADLRISGFFAQEPSLKTVLALFTHVNTLPSPPYNLRLCALHAACNLFTTPLATGALRTNADLSATLVALATPALLDASHPALRVSASALALNLATAEHRKRVEHSEAPPLLPDAQQVEMAASLLEAISAFLDRDAPALADAEVEAAKMQVLALGRLVYCAPDGGEVLDLCQAMGARELFLEKADGTGAEEVRLLMREIGTELLKDS